MRSASENNAVARKMLQQSCFAQTSVDPGLDLAQVSRQYHFHDGVGRLVLTIFKGFVAELHPCVVYADVYTFG